MNLETGLLVGADATQAKRLKANLIPLTKKKSQLTNLNKQLILLQKLMFAQPVKKLPALYETQNFIILFTKARHYSVSSARSIQTTFTLYYF
jgi:hypothetical protein